MTAVFVFLALISTLWTVAGVVCVLRVRRRRPTADRTTLPPVSVLKPLCGVDAALEDNLRGFFTQDYPRYQIVFGVQGADDPAISVVRKLRAQHPEIDCQLVVHDGGRGINPKVSNLRAMLTAVRHDVVVISDSNVAVATSYLAEMAAALQEPGVGLVTNLFAGTGEKTLGATLENLQLATDTAPGVALATELFDHPIVVGKSMMFRRSTFERLGGFESVANVLAEDYVIGRMFKLAGHRIRLVGQPIRNVNETTTVQRFVDRHVRWGMIRVRLAPVPYFLEPLTRPLLLALVAPLLGVMGPGPLLWAVGLTLLRDAILWTALRGPAGLLRALPLFPLRDLLVTAAWVVTPFRRRVRWRGKRVRVCSGTRLYAEHEPEPPTALTIEA